MRALLLFLSFAGYYGLSQGCSCWQWPPDERQSYCDADFALLVRVKRNLSRKGKDWQLHYYKIKIQKKYKMENSLFISDQTKVYTGFSGASCGISLKKGSRYMITGMVDKVNKRMTIFLCTSWIGYQVRKSKRKAKRYQKYESRDRCRPPTW